MSLSEPAFSSIGVPVGLRATGSMRKVCCACCRPTFTGIDKYVAWCVYGHQVRKMPSAFTASASIWCRRSYASGTHPGIAVHAGSAQKAVSALMGARSAADRTGDGRELAHHLRAELDRLRRQLVMTLELIREVEAERDEAANVDPTNETCRKIASLCLIRGVGANFATVVTREVFYRSFENRRQLASYVGITPMLYKVAGWTGIGA